MTPIGALILLGLLGLGANGQTIVGDEDAPAQTPMAILTGRGLLSHDDKRCTPANCACSLYANSCCGGPSKRFCTMSTACSSPKSVYTSRCVPICRPLIKRQVRKIMIDKYIAWETGSHKAPAILVLQEWWGVNDAIKQMAEHLAEQGYRTLIPDIYQGKVALNVAEALHLSQGLDWAKAVKQMQAAVKYLRKTGSPRVGVIGFCQGGGLTLCAGQYAKVDAIAPFYGIPPNTTCQPEKIKVPIQYHLGRNDTSFPEPQVKAVFEKIYAARNSPDAKLYLYPDTGHSFMNGLIPEGRELLLANNRPLPPEMSVTRAFARMTSFFAHYLKK